MTSHASVIVLLCIGLPDFTDDLVVTVRRVKDFCPTRMPGTQ